MLAKDIMIKDILTVNKDLSVKQCIDIFFKMHIGSVVVTDENKKVVGIFTDRDVNRVISQGFSLDTPLDDVMTTNVVTVKSDCTFGEVKELMRLYRIRHIPVVDSTGKLEGLISLRHIIDEFFEIIPRTRTQ